MRAISSRRHSFSKLIAPLFVCLFVTPSAVFAEPLSAPVATPSRGVAAHPRILEGAIAREVARLTRTGPAWRLANPLGQAPTAKPKRGWVRRHPVLVGALVGFGSGFLIGYLPGDDGVFDDFTAGFNGAVSGGVGAGAGALVGLLASRH